MGTSTERQLKIKKFMYLRNDHLSIEKQSKKG